MAKPTRDEALAMLLSSFMDMVQLNRGQADYLIPRNDEDKRHKAWLEGRAQAFERSAELLRKVLNTT